MTYKNSHIKGWLRVVLIIVAYLFVGGIFYTLGLIASDSGINTTANQRSVLQNIIIVFFDFLAVLGLLAFFIKVIDNESYSDIGLKIKNRTKDITIGLLLGFFIMGFALLTLFYFEDVKLEKVNFGFENLIYIFLLFSIISQKKKF